ncbi:MAG TPA: PKD domain-containing protein [Myxococcota bacterium]|nr:PKD domain-containing protein [Myxococcota bacterium]
MSVLRLTGLLVVPALLLPGLACDSFKPVELNTGGSDTAPGNDDPEDSASEPGGSDTPIVDPNTGNTTPHANAGLDQSDVIVGDLVFLDGTGSTDADGDSLTYKWDVSYRPSGSAASVSNATFPTAQIYVDKPGSYEIRLTVSDGAASDDDVMRVDVEKPNEPPVADAGIDQRVTVGQLVQLSGARSADPDGDSLEYRWTIVSKPPTSVAQLVGATVQPATSPRFTADVAGVFTVELIVWDGEAASPPDLVQVTVDAPDSGGGSNSGSDCLSCSAGVEVAQRRMSTGDAAQGLAMSLLPVAVLFWQRRRYRS